MKNVAKVLNIGIIFILVFSFINCDSGEKNEIDKKDLLAKSKTELINTDTEFFNLSQKIGTGQAFINYADEGAVILRQGSFPVIGKQAIRELYKGRESKVTPLTWKPVKANVSEEDRKSVV